VSLSSVWLCLWVCMCVWVWVWGCCACVCGFQFVCVCCVCVCGLQCVSVLYFCVRVDVCEYGSGVVVCVCVCVCVCVYLFDAQAFLVHVAQVEHGLGAVLLFGGQPIVNDGRLIVHVCAVA